MEDKPKLTVAEVMVRTGVFEPPGDRRLTTYGQQVARDTIQSAEELGVDLKDGEDRMAILELMAKNGEVDRSYTSDTLKYVIDCNVELLRAYKKFREAGV